MLSCPWRVERVPACEDSGAVCLIMRTDEVGFEDIRQAHSDIQFPDQIFKAVRSRQIDFFAGRLLAKLALKKLGSDHTSVTIGTHREPVWPSSFVGSITHSRNIVAVLVVNHNDLLVGIDIEHKIASDQCDSLADILNDRELSTLAQTGLDKAESYTLGFSVKETLFKAVFPRVNRYLEFNQSTLQGYDHKQRRVDIELHVDGVSSQYVVSVIDLGIFLVTFLSR